MRIHFYPVTQLVALPPMLWTFWQPILILGSLTLSTSALAQSIVSEPPIPTIPDPLTPDRLAVTGQSSNRLSIIPQDQIPSGHLPGSQSTVPFVHPDDRTAAFRVIPTPQLGLSPVSRPTVQPNVPRASLPTVQQVSRDRRLGQAADLGSFEPLTRQAESPTPTFAIDATHTLQSFPSELDSPNLASQGPSWSHVLAETLPTQAQSTSPQLPYVDPDLGILLLREMPFSPCSDGLFFHEQYGCIPCPPNIYDPDLGCVSVGAPPVPRPPIVYFLPRIDYFNSSNVFSQRLNTVRDGLTRPGLTLLVVPPLGPKTYLIASVEGNLIRYTTLSEIDYNELKFRAGIFQQLSSKMSLELSWTNQQLFLQRDQVFRLPGQKIPGLKKGTRFFNEHAFQLSISRRDQLAKRLSLSTLYQLRVAFADPIAQASVIIQDPPNQSRVTNAFIASLNYEIQPNLQAGLDYQLSISQFTRQSREDTYHQIIGRLSYALFRNTQLTGFVGYSFGRSSDSTINFDSLLLGISLTFNLALF